MWTIFRKELSSFFDSYVGVGVIFLFVLCAGIVFWIYPETSILAYGVASMDSYFQLAPFLLIFFIPALSMLSFPAERKAGTLEWLRSKPISVADLLLGKYLAVFLVIVLAIVPSLIYVVSLSFLAHSQDSIDWSSIFVSYAGLFLLAAALLALCIAISAFCNQAIVAFLISIALSMLLYRGLNLNDAVPHFALADAYQMLSRAVFDSRPVLYLCSINFLFLYLAWIRLYMDGLGRRRRKHLFLPFLTWIVVVFALNYLGTVLFIRYDFSEGERYKLSEITKSTLGELSTAQPLHIKVYLGGNLPNSYKRLRKETEDFLQDLRFAAPNGSLSYEFISPADWTQEQKAQAQDEMGKFGLGPMPILENHADGSRTQRLLYPIVSLTFDGKIQYFSLFENNEHDTTEEHINRSISNLSYQFTSKISRLLDGKTKVVGFTEGQGELADTELQDALWSLSTNFQVGRIDLDQISLADLTKVDVLIVAKPQFEFSEPNKYKLDQFIMQGGKVIWSLDKNNASLDSLGAVTNRVQVVQPLELNLDDLLFVYGLRLPNSLLVDLNASAIPIAFRGSNSANQATLSGETGKLDWLPWPLHPVIVPNSEHLIVQHVEHIRLENAGILELLDVDGVRQEILLTSSPYSRAFNLPRPIDLTLPERLPPFEEFRGVPMPVMALLEGEFPSAFKNRPIPADFPPNAKTLERSKPTAMIAIADGDIFKNQLNPADRSAYPLGWDRYQFKQYANKSLLLNAIDYLVNDKALIALKAKQHPIRMLDRAKLSPANILKLQLVNVALPLLLLLVGVALRLALKRRRYSRL